MSRSVNFLPSFGPLIYFLAVHVWTVHCKYVDAYNIVMHINAKPHTIRDISSIPIKLYLSETSFSSDSDVETSSKN